MKKLRFCLVVLMVLGGLDLVQVIHGQTGTANEIEFKMSTPFVAGDAKFPAGTYTIRQDADDQLEWEISNDAKDFSAFLPTEALSSTSPNQKTEVTFQKYGNTLVLKEIWIPRLSRGYSVQSSYAEKKASKAGSPTKVSVAANKK